MTIGHGSTRAAMLKQANTTETSQGYETKSLRLCLSG